MPGELRVTVTITPEHLARAFEQQMHGLSIREKAGVMNVLLHEHRAVFDALLRRAPRESCGVSIPPRPEISALSPHDRI